MNQEPLNKLLGEIFDSIREGDDAATHARLREDFVFHMTDWLHNLSQLNEIVERPEQWNPQAAGRLVAGFLMHVVPHLNEAGRLLLDDIPNPFRPQPEKKV